MWECTWKRTISAPAVKLFLDIEFRRRRGVKWQLTRQQILDAVCAGTLFGLVECDIRVPENLCQHFAEMLPVFKNTTVSRDDIGPFMRQYARQRYHAGPAALASGKLSQREDASRHTAPTVVPRLR